MKLTKKQLCVSLSGLLLWQGGYFLTLPAKGAAPTAPQSPPQQTVSFAAPTSAKSAPKRLDPKVQKLLKQFCFRCHKTGKARGGLDLTKDITPLDIQKNGKHWQKVVIQTRNLIMPPEDEKQPTMQDRVWLADTLESILRDINFEDHKNAGKPTLRRLNRSEYTRTIQDLMGINIQASRGFPDDAKGYGFNNMGDVMFLSPLLLEKYLDATQRILDATFSNPNALEKLLFAKPSDKLKPQDAAQKVISRFMERAFRRPPTSTEIKSRIKLFTRAYRKDKDYNQAIKIAFKSILLSPEFLFRVEREKDLIKDKDSYRVNDFQLATRLSYFLWSTAPDQELYNLAKAGKLSNPKTLSAQIKRMLAHKKSIAFSEEFGAQWLRFNEILTWSADIRRFRGFGGMRSSMYQESLHFFDDLVKNNRSILNLLDSDYTFLNRRLANYYGIPNVKGNNFKKVKLPNRQRGGALGMGSILSITSMPLRTSPVLRGKWVLEEILGTEVPPAPADAGTLPKDDHQKDGLSFRKRLEQHRDDPACASCHRLMDPIGFGLENYDGAGKWRDKSLEQPIDASGTLPTGESFDGPAQLKDILIAKKDDFARQITQKMLIYAYGRPLEYYDEPHIQAGVRALQQNDYKIHALIQNIVNSYPFTHREKK